MMLAPKRPRQSLGKLKPLPSYLVITSRMMAQYGQTRGPLRGLVIPSARPQPPTFHLQPSWASLLGVVGHIVQPLPYEPEGSN